MAESSAGGSVWLYSDDLIFSDRIASVVASQSIPFRRITEADLVGLPSHRGLLILDLDKGLDPITGAITLARSAAPGAWHICGYGSHIDVEGLRSLRDVGADRVTSKSRLFQVLELMIRESIIG